MEPKKNLFLRIAGFLLTILGFSNCTSCDRFMRCEYGTPHADFDVSGYVKDEEGKPIQGINVHGEFYSNCQTKEDGSFSMIGEDFPMNPYRLTFEDIDGPENGGEFETKTVEVEVRKIEKGSGNWYAGKFKASDVNVTLERKQAE